MPGLLHIVRGNLKPRLTVSLNLEDEMLHMNELCIQNLTKMAIDASAKTC